MYIDTIELKDLYDKDYDSAVDGKCCRNLKYIEFPEVTLCNGVPCTKLYPNVRISNAQSSYDDPFTARFCLDIVIFRLAYWRICHRNKNQIQRLRMNIVTQTIKNMVPKIDSAVMCK